MLELNYKEFGQGEPIIILHGLFGTLDNWQTIAKKLAEEYTVFIIDQRNHGRSPHHKDLNYPVMAEDLKNFMESNWIYEARIIGHSMGGKTAMQFALNYPDMVEKLVVVDIGPNENPAGHQTIFEALFSLDLERTESRKEAEQQLGKLIDDIAVRQFLLKNLSRDKETGHYKWKMNLSAIHENYANILAAVKGDDVCDRDALFVKGGKSDYLEDSDLQDIQALFPAAKMQTIAESGHWVHAEAPVQFLALLRKFLQS